MKHFLSLICVMIIGAQAQASGNSLLGINLGMDRGVMNFGATVDSAASTGSVGGHLFIQTEKASAGVAQIMSLAAHVRLAVFEQNKFSLAFNPGFGMHMLKGLGLGVDDKTLFGPTLRWRVTYDLGNNMLIGLDRLEMWNWFNDTSIGGAAYTSAVLMFNF